MMESIKKILCFLCSFLWCHPRNNQSCIKIEQFKFELQMRIDARIMLRAAEIENKKLDELLIYVDNHYWNSYNKDKDLIMFHLKHIIKNIRNCGGQNDRLY